MGTNPRDAVIAVEQKAVDRAYECYERQLREMTAQSPASASASGKDSIVTKADAERRAAEYGGLDGEALVISRVDVHEPGEPERETWYVGRRTVADVETGDRLVVSWTTPLAVKWHNARPETPGELLLRRRLRCAEQTVEDYFDEISREGPPADGVVAGESTLDRGAGPVPPVGADEPAVGDGPAPQFVPAPREVSDRLRRKPTQVDEFLLRELHRSRSGRMRDIVETIRRDQMALVTDSPADVLVVQGGPGTGKSAVGLHRVTWLVNNDHFRVRDILVVGPHQGFLEYVGRVLPTLGTRNVNAVQLARLWAGDIRGADSAETRLIKSDDRMAEVLRRRVATERRPGALDTLFVASSDERDEPAFMVTIGSTSLRLPRSVVLELLRGADEAGGAYRARRDRFRHQLVDRLLSALAEIAPRRGREATVRRDLERNRQVVALVERAWPALSPEEALRSLFDSADRLRECASGILDESEQAALRRPRAGSAAEEAWTADDLVCLEELRFLIAGETPQHYRHIVIDEAQDLTPMQARSLRLRCPTGSMTVLGDLAQATGPHPYDDWERLGALLAEGGAWRATELNTSYRIPAQIMEFVAPLARAVAPALPFPVAVRRAESEPVSLVALAPAAVPDAVLARVRGLIGTDGRTSRSIAVVVPDGSRWSAELGAFLDGADSLTPEQRATVSVLVASQVKGMEYDHVVVLDPAAIVDREPAGARQLYVALTRSTQSLTILYTSPLPEILIGGDPQDGSPVAPDHSPAVAETDTVRDAAEADTVRDAAEADTVRDAAEAAVASGPETTSSPTGPAVGDRVRVRVVAAGKGPHRKVQAIAPVTTRTLFLVARHGSPAPAIGAELDAWVVRVEARVTLVSAGDFGRRPIHSGMIERFAAALDVLNTLSEPEGGFPSNATTCLADLKDLASRCLRRDQADWLSVWRLLGSPDTERLIALRDLAQRTRDTLGLDASTVSAGLRSDPTLVDWSAALAAARVALRARIDDEPRDGGSPDAQAPTPAPRNQIAPKGAESDHDAQHIAHPGQAPVNTTLSDELAAASGADRNCNTHEAVRHELKAALLWAGLKPSDSPTIDVGRVGGDGHFVYEVLGAGLCGYADLRAGATRLLEIDYSLPRRADRLYLVLSAPPAEDWAADTIKGVFGVHVLWRTPSGWEGHDTATALGPGNAGPPEDA